jgi:hypothetical protein
MSRHDPSPKEIASDDTVMTVHEGPQEVASRFFPNEEDDQQRAALCEAIEDLLDAAPGEDETTPEAIAVRFFPCDTHGAYREALITDIAKLQAHRIAQAIWARALKRHRR